MIPHLLISLRRLVLGQEGKRARVAQRTVAEQSYRQAHADRARFGQAMACEPSASLVLGRGRRLDESPFWCGQPIEEFLGVHSWITGATGSGKSFFALSCLLQVLRSGRHPVVIVDMKSELSDLLIEMVIPKLLSAGGGEKVLERLRIIRPFGQDLPMLRVTEAEAGVPLSIQAFNLASALEEGLGDDLGSRMSRVFLRLSRLAIELELPLTIIQRWLEQPAVFARDAARSKDASLREYAMSGFARESRPAIDALLARLDSFLFLDEVRLALSAPGCVSFAEALESGVTIVDLGSPPAGAERAQRFWAGILTGRITRAILSRPVTPETPRSWVIFEEVQEALGKNQAEQFCRLLTLARHKRVAVTLINQQAAQLGSANPTLVKVLRTNASIECAFRCNLEDAKPLVQAMPLPPDARRLEATRQSMVQELTQLPDREFLLWMKRMPFGAQRVRSPRLDVDDLRRCAEGLSPEVRAAIRHGTVSMDRDTLEASLAAAEGVEQEGQVPSPRLTAAATRNRSKLG
jgi:Helicase HerA, central domain